MAVKHIALLAIAVACAQIVVAASRCPAVPSELIDSTSWAKCDDLPNFECRRVTNRRDYDPASPAGTITRLERRRLVGTPKVYVFLISGGPGGNADVLARAVEPQVVTALGTDFAVHVPSLRGTKNTDHIEDYPAFPERFVEHVRNASYEPTTFSISNSAIDVILSVRQAKAEFPNAVFVAAGFSYGTYQIQRMLLIEPNLFSHVIFDGPVPAVNHTNVFWSQSMGLVPLTRLLNNNCQRNEFCRTHSLSLGDLIDFVDDLEDPEGPSSNPCMDAFVDSAAKGAPPAQVFHNIVRNLAMVSNVEIPRSLWSEDPANPAVAAKYLDAALKTFAGEKHDASDKEYIYFEFRSILWALMNQFAQCDNFARLISFSEAMKPLGQLLQTMGAVNTYFLSPESPIGNTYITQTLALLSEGRVPAASKRINDQIKAAQRAGPIRNAANLFQMEDVMQDIQTKMGDLTDCFSNRAPSNVQANVLFLDGLLDPNAPHADNIAAFEQFEVASGFKKVNYTHNNAGHTVISLGWSKCSPLVIRAWFKQDATALAEYESCLKAENTLTVDWELKAMTELTGHNIWAGLPQSSVLYYVIISAAIAGGILAIVLIVCCVRCVVVRARAGPIRSDSLYVPLHEDNKENDEEDNAKM